jgi:hypothetical protein
LARAEGQPDLRRLRHDGVGILPEYPILSGWHADYLAHAARLSQRPAQECVMAGMARALGQDILGRCAERRPSLRR